MGKITGETCLHKVGAAANWVDVINQHGCSPGNPAMVSAWLVELGQPEAGEHRSYWCSESKQIYRQLQSRELAAAGIGPFPWEALALQGMRGRAIILSSSCFLIRVAGYWCHCCLMIIFSKLKENKNSCMRLTGDKWALICSDRWRE